MMFFLAIMSPSVKHSFNFNISDHIIDFFEIKLNPERRAEPARNVNVLVLETIVMHHILIEPKLMGDIIQSPNEVAFQVVDCQKNITLITALLLGQLLDEILVLLV